MPGRQDFISVLGADGKRLHMQKRKRLLLCNLKEALNEKHPDLKAGFSRFASLLPRECIIAVLDPFAYVPFTRMLNG